MARLGHRSSRSLLVGTFNHLWSDYRITPGYDPFSPSLRIGLSRTHNLSKQPLNIPKVPFELLFMDIIPTPRMRALTIATAFPSSLLIVDAYTRYSMWIGLPKYRTSDIIEAITHFLV